MRLSNVLGAAIGLLLASGVAVAAQPATAEPPATSQAGSSRSQPAALDIAPFKMRYRVLRDGWHLGNATFTLLPTDSGT